MAARELTLRKTEGDTRLTLGVYRYDYDGYIYAETLDRFEDFRLIRYGQTDAVFTGVEAELHHDVNAWLSLEVFGDAVRGQLSNGDGNAPRIPASRLGARAEFLWDAWSGDIEYHHVFDQDDVAAFETETPGYEMVNLTVARDFSLGGVGAQAYLRGNNLLDEVALNHASFLSDIAPLRGRNFVLGVRATF